MKAVLILAGLLVSSAAVAAIPETTELTCQEARAYVKRNSPTVMTTYGADYVRYVSEQNGSDCFDDENAVQAFVQTLDAKNCPVAYICVDKDLNGSLSNSDD